MTDDWDLTSPQYSLFLPLCLPPPSYFFTQSSVSHFFFLSLLSTSLSPSLLLWYPLLSVSFLGICAPNLSLSPHIILSVLSSLSVLLQAHFEEVLFSLETNH